MLRTGDEVRLTLTLMLMRKRTLMLAACDARADSHGRPMLEA